MAIYTPPDYRELYEKEKEQSARLAAQAMNAIETLRDKLAMTILPGLMLRYKEPGYSDISATAEAYRIADDMLEARKAR